MRINRKLRRTENRKIGRNPLRPWPERHSLAQERATLATIEQLTAELPVAEKKTAARKTFWVSFSMAVAIRNELDRRHRLAGLLELDNRVGALAREARSL